MAARRPPRRHQGRGRMSADLPTPASLQGGPIYLDYNATTPVDPRVVESMLPYLTTHFGNPSSSHHYAEQPRRALATARRQVAGLIGAAADEIVFSGSGSEADALAIHGTVVVHRRPSDVQVITQVTEHPAVLEACRALHRRYGTEVTYLPVGHDGRVDTQHLAEAITPRTALVSIMAANNKTGVLQPIDKLARVTRQRARTGNASESWLCNAQLSVAVGSHRRGGGPEPPATHSWLMLRGDDADPGGPVGRRSPGATTD